MKKISKKPLVLIFIIVLSALSVFSFSTVGHPSDQKEEVYYTCPMPEHADVALDKPGKCPKCGMNLVPKNISAIKYVCPMKEDAEVTSDKPGKCPKCGMKLVEKKVALVQFVCPMQEHADVALDKPGKCPKCGMNLVPKEMKGSQ